MITDPFRFGVQEPSLTDLEEIAGAAGAARRAEALGYDELFSYDHVTTVRELGGSTDLVDPLLPLQVAALATTTLRIGPLVLNNELHHPALLARAAATIDRLTGGRFVLGIGSGYAQAEHDAIGLPLRAPGPRVDRLDECLTIIRRLLDAGSASFAGQHHTVEIAELGIRPVQDRVPILLGGHGRRMIGLAARHADVFQFTGLTHDERGTPGPGGFGIEQVRQRAGWLSEAAGERDRHIERSALVQHTDVGDHADLSAPAQRLGWDERAVLDTPFLLVGSVAQLVDELERRREDIGISHYVVRDAEGFAPVVDALRGR